MAPGRPLWENGWVSPRAESAPGRVRRAADEHAARLARAYGGALRAGDARAAKGVVREAVAEGLAPAAVQARVIAPAMHWIGELWQVGALTVADEHLATGISHAALAELYATLVHDVAPSGLTVVLAAPEGEQHVMGLRMAADALEWAGWEALYLGADVPVGALRDTVADREPAAVALTLSMPLGTGALEHAIAAAQEARPGVRIVLGGRGVPPHLRRRFAWAATTEDLPAVAAGDGRPQPPIVARRRIAVRTTGIGVGAAAFEERLAGATEEAADVARLQARLARDFRRLAYEDPLTGLPNRRAFDDRFADVGDAALIVLDVDRFKDVNDTRGHEEGDRVLQEVGSAIAAAIRPLDFAARLGGDEFAVLLPGLAAEGAVAVAERVRAAAVERAGVSVSIGVTRVGAERRAAKLAADHALYAAKNAGRNKVEISGGV